MPGKRCQLEAARRWTSLRMNRWTTTTTDMCQVVRPPLTTMPAPTTNTTDPTTTRKMMANTAAPPAPMTTATMDPRMDTHTTPTHPGTFHQGELKVLHHTNATRLPNWAHGQAILASPTAPPHVGTFQNGTFIPSDNIPFRGKGEPPTNRPTEKGKDKSHV